MGERRMTDCLIEDFGWRESSARFFEALIIAARTGDTGPLLRMIEAGHPTDDGERDLLAAYIRGEFDEDKKRGPKTPEEVLRAAQIVTQVKRAFRDDGYVIRGNRRHEAALACAFAYLREHGHPVPDRDKLENYLRRARK